MNILKKSLAYFLVLAMVFVMIPFTASAAVEVAVTIYGDDGPYTEVCVEDDYFVIEPNVGSALHWYSDQIASRVLLLGGEYDGRIHFTVTGEADITIYACSHIYDTTTELTLEELTEGTVANYEFADFYTSAGEWDSSEWEVTWTISLGPGVYYLDGSSVGPVAISRIDVSETTDAPHTHALEEVVDQAPSCTQKGSGRIACSCGIVAQTVTYPVVEHDYEATGTVAPTCRERGYTNYTCYVCGHTKKDNYVAALGHNYVDGVCTVCGKHNPATCEHAYNAVVTPPTCVDAGYTTYTCPKCDRSYNDNYVSALTYGEYTYTFNANDELFGSSAIPGNVGTEGFFRVSGFDAEDTDAYANGYIVLDKESTRKISFDVKGYADVKVTIVASAHDKDFGLCDWYGEECYVDSEISEFTFNVAYECYDKTFDIYAYEDDEDYGDVRIYSITVEVSGVSNHTYETAVKEPTCTEAGGTVHTCTVCGDSYMTDKVAALGHSYSSVVTAPTCTEQGFTTYTCTVCGDSYVADYVDALGHSYSSVVTAPTCTKQGFTTYTCTVCGDSYVADYVDALGHIYEDGICTGCGRYENGVESTYTFYAPDLTAEKDNEAIADGSYVGTNDYFQVTGSVKKRVSSNIVKYVELLKNEGGKFAFEVTGVADVVVKACSTSSSNTSVVALMDANGNVIISDLGGIVEVTGTGNGVDITYTDLPAGTYYIVSPTENVYKRNTRIISINVVETGLPAHEHSYEAVVTPPTCTEQGYTTYTCSCGSSYIDDEILPLGHSYTDGICGICGAADPDYVAPVEKFDLVGANVALGNDLTMNFFVSKDYISDTDYIEIVKYYGDDREPNPVVTTVAYKDFDDYYGTYWQVSLKGMAAKEMADKIEVTVYNADGVAISNTYTGSIRDYCVNQMAKPAMAEAYTLLADMLNYGAAAQTQFNYNLDDLANSTMTAEQAAYATQDFDLGNYSNNMVKGENFIGSSLALETNIVLTMYFNKLESTNGLTAIVTYTDHLGAAQRLEIAEKDFVTLAGAYYGVVVDTLVASDVRQIVTLEVYDGDTLVASGADSMEGYAVRQGGDMNIALMKFTLSAYAYLHRNDA